MRAAALASASRSGAESASNAARHSEPGISSAAALGARTRSKRAVYSSTAASPRLRTSARIASTLAPSAASSFASNAVSSASAVAKPGADASRRLIDSTGSGIGFLFRRGFDRVEQRLQQRPLELERRRVDDQSCADRQDVFHHD